MKKLLIATVAVLVSVAAVDWARATPVATPWSWTGFYVGGNDRVGLFRDEQLA